MNIQTDIFGVFKSMLYYGSKKDKLILSFFECISVVIDFTFGLAKLRPELFDRSHVKLRVVCLVAVALYSFTILTPWLMTMLNDRSTSNYFVLILSTACAPIYTLLIDNRDRKKKLMYTTTALSLMFLSIPLTWPTNPWVFVVCQAGLTAESLLHVLQRKYGEFRVEMGVGSALITSTLFFLFGTRTSFNSDDMLILNVYTFLAWAFQLAKSRFSARVENNTFVMAMARLERVSIHVFLSYLVMPANAKHNASGMAALLVFCLCVLATNKYYK